MPTYSYTCEGCRHELDAFQNITEDPLVHCPKCGQDALKRGIGGGFASFQFKGKGFYQTDYKQSTEGSSSTSSCCPCGKGKNNCSN